MTARRISCIVLATLICGCSTGPERVHPPGIDADEAGKAAVTQYDGNGDGLIGSDELEKAAGLLVAISKIDQNGDGQLSADEIASRIKAWQDTKVGIMGMSARVMLDGKPLEGGTITIVPEKFLGPNVKPATGKIGPGGSASLTIDDADLAARRLYGVQTGFYRVEITSDAKSVPAKYNTDTTLGVEVAQDAPWVQLGGVNFDLKSR